MRFVYVVNYMQANGYLVRLPRFLAPRLVKWLQENEFRASRCWDFMTPAAYRREEALNAA